MKQPELKKRLRPEEILVAGEKARSSELVRLFGESIGMVAEDPNKPTECEFILGRSITATLWDYDRMTGNAETLMKGILSQEYAPERRRARYLEASDRGKMQHLVVNHIRSTLVLMRELRNASNDIATQYDPDHTLNASGGKLRLMR